MDAIVATGSERGPRRDAASRRPLRVMHVVNALGVAGLEYGVIKICNGLDPTLFEPSVCSIRFEGDGAREILHSRIPSFQLDRGPGEDFRVVPRLAELLQRQRIDILHSHNWLTCFYALAAAYLARTPVVIHGEHGRDELEVPAERLGRRRLLAQRARHLVTVSENLRMEMINRWLLPGERITSIPNGVDLAAFGSDYDCDSLRREFNLEPSHRVILNIGRIEPIKDHATLLEAFARVHQRRPECRLLLVGKGERAGLESQAAALGIRSAVLFAGLRREIPPILRMSAVYVNSSRFEGMSNTILEAMASRLPVVATAVGGNPELVRDGRTGYLVPPGDPASMADRLERLLGDPNLSAEMGREARRIVETHHSLDGMIRAYAELYTSVWQRRSLERHAPIAERLRLAAAGVLCRSRRRPPRSPRTPPRLIILAYHRVLPLSEALRYPFPGMVLAKDLFEAQMWHLSRRYNVLPLGRAIRSLQTGDLPEGAVALTFDDGYADNYEHAWPILERCGLPATFFLVTRAVDRELVLWWDEVAAVVERLATGGAAAKAVDLVRLPKPVGEILSALDHGASAQTVCLRLVRALNGTPREGRTSVLERLGIPQPRVDGDRPNIMMTWAQVQEMRASGAEFGAHTEAHEFLDETDPLTTRREIGGSVRTITERLGARVTLFAYPSGRFSPSVLPALREAGIEAAVTTEGGWNGPGQDLYRLKRMDAGFASTRTRFSRSLFDAEVQGVFNPIRKLAEGLISQRIDA